MEVEPRSLSLSTDYQVIHLKINVLRQDTCLMLLAKLAKLDIRVSLLTHQGFA